MKTDAQLKGDVKAALPGAPRDDVDLAEAIAHVLALSVQVPEDRVPATAEHGWVTLEGDVDHDHQRHEVERMARHVRGVTGLLNNIMVRLRVEVSDHTAGLYGQVHSRQESNAAAAAASAPGAASMQSHLVIAP